MDILSDNAVLNIAWDNIFNTVREILTYFLIFPLFIWLKPFFSNLNIKWLQLGKPFIKYDLFLKPEKKEISGNQLVKILQECWFSICCSDTDNYASSLMTSVSNLKSKDHDY